MERTCRPLLEEYLQLFPCVAIIGPRQCGKTTLLGTLPSTWKRFDLEDEADHQVVSRDPALFLELNSEQVAIDEAQFLPELFRALRVAVDRRRAHKGRFVLTGSSSPDLVRSLSESLAGRVGIIEMAPFTASEAHGMPTAPLADFLASGRPHAKALAESLRPRISLQAVHDYWFRGGFPEPWMENTERFRQAWMQQYVRTYLERDIARLFPGLNQDRFRTFIRLLAGLSGQVINYSDIARALGVSQPTARDYFDIAHGSFLWRTLPAFDRKSMKRIVRHSKGYLRDSGLLHHLLRVPDRDSLLSHPIQGASWEGIVIENLLRGLAARGVDFDAFHYRTGGGAEVDLVLEGAFGLVPVEIKYARTVEPARLRSLTDFVHEWKCPLGIILHNDEKPRLYSEKLLGLPFSCL